MRIAYIAAGAAGMYCGSCLNDNALAAALTRAGHDVALVPTYTPLRTDDDNVSIDRVFYGAINVYLEQKSALFRHTPWLVDRMLNRRGLLRWASRRGASVDARQLGELTLSVLQGEDGRQRKELDKLVTWLRDEFRPDVVHLTNSMFLGVARRLRAALSVPVLCTVQGEDIFLEELEEPYYSRVREQLLRTAGDVDAFVTHSAYYAEFMAQYLGVPAARMHQVPLGLKLEGHGPSPAGPPAEPFTVGYLARICPEKGLHLLAAAFHELANEVGRDRVRLRVAGYLGARDQSYKEGILAQIREWGLAARVDDVGEIDRRQKIEFLRGLHVLSVPTTYREPKGLFVLEALANGVPVVLPRHGAFPELVEATGGGLLVEPNDTASLARALRELLDDPPRREALGRRGGEVVRREYSDAVAAERTLQIYRRYVDNGASRSASA